MAMLLQGNMTTVEMVLRVLLGIALLAGVMSNGLLPIWAALVAVYPVITAMISWDPVYALVASLRAPFAVAPQSRKAIAVG